MIRQNAEEVNNAQRRDHPYADKVVDLMVVIELNQRNKAEAEATQAVDSKTDVLRRFSLMVRKGEAAEYGGENEGETALRVIVSTGYERALGWKGDKLTATNT